MGDVPALFRVCSRSSFLYALIRVSRLHRTLILSYRFRFFSQPLPRNIRNRNAKFDGNINKRGAVPIGKAAEHTDEFPVNKILIAFFMVVVVGSSLVQVLNLFKTAPPPV
jgi:hypothetical protein